MASPSSNSEALEIRRRGRQRLIGAIALVLLLVVFVPMVLDSEPRPARDTPSLAIPSKDNPAPMPAVAPVAPSPGAQNASDPAAKGEAGKPAAAAPAAPPEAAKPPVEPPPAAAKVEPAPVPAEPASPAKPAPGGGNPGAGAQAPAKAAAPAKSAAPSAPPKEGFAVQVGAFRDEAKLKQAREKLVSAGLKHYVEKLEVKSGPLTRLRVGPYPTREAAEAALVNVKRASLDGKVVPLP